MSKDRSLASSYLEFAKRLKDGRGFWNGNVICNDPAACRDKRKEMIALANSHS